MPKTHHAPSTISPIILLLAVVSFSLFLSTAQDSATPAWTGGPEDTFFCGYKWDDPDCLTRQHCPSGQNEECELFADGQKCFANSPCDTRYGDGSGFVPGQAVATSNSSVSSPMATPSTPVTPRPTFTGVSDDPTDHRWCGVGLDEAKTCVQHCPSGETSECPQGMICFPDITECDARNIPPDTLRPTEKVTPAPTISLPPLGPTKIPTDMPIPPPDPLPYPSDDPTDHWFCGVGIDDANNKCSLHCPSANECPIGQTLHPTASMPPSFAPTTSARPTAAPSLPMPTTTPTKSPTGRPTWAPLPALQLTFWNDAVDNCKKRCPTGEDTECPNGDFCFTGTPCTEEQGYPETDDSTDGGGSSGGQDCVPFQVTITADAWPNEISWVVNNTETEELVANGGNDDLVSGEPFDYPVECINNRKGCYAFTILDSGGDGLCCSEGQGSYTISYDGVELMKGDAFYDYETTQFGLCGATETPTKYPTFSSIDLNSVDKPSGAAVASSSGAGFRCVDHSLADRGYQISTDKCNLFDDCFNPQIKVGDDWFCDESSTCIEAPACGDAAESSVENAGDESAMDNATPAPVASAVASPDKTPAPMLESETTTNAPEMVSVAPSVAAATTIKTQTPSALSNFLKTSAPIVSLDITTKSPQVSTRPPKVTSPGKVPIVQKPSVVSTGDKGENATIIPTLIPTTSSPTLGPCDGEPCNQEGHCRSQYGFCGPGETYCNEKATWTEDCPDSSSSSSPMASSEPPTVSSTNVDIIMSTMSPSTKKSSGWTKPGGGKGSVSRPARTHPPTEPFPYFVYPALTQPMIPTGRPSPAPISIDSGPPSPFPMTQVTTSSPTFDHISDSGNPTFSSGYSSVSPTVTSVASVSPSVTTFDFTALPTKSVIETTPPTQNAKDLSASPSTAVDTLPPTVSATAKATNEFTCTGERCPVDSHCRSRYGSCGPGFIYCNDYSIWDSTCPLPVPGVTPTRSPTAKPTSNDTEINTPPSLMAQPSFPPIAKPTLPTITEAVPFVPGDNIGKGFLETDKVESDAAEGEVDKSGANASPSAKPVSDKFQTAEYLDLWADIARSRGNRIMPLPTMFIAAIAAIYLLIDLL
eukprot:CCRYP_005498-RC/>CCRYP_005498-RC protein AED:0.05 eAED:0.05 QI:373/0.81/0.91/1/0.54/0.58/12/4229/1098